MAAEFPSNQTPSSVSAILAIASLITQFEPLFQPPTVLPPSRPTNHHIHLIPGTGLFIVFFDDILIYSSIIEEHVRHLEKTFQVLMEGSFFLKLSKCSFGQQQVKYLGHFVSAQGVEPIHAKVQAIQHWPSPNSLKALRSFLGLVGFYRRFICGYASIAAPLTTVLTKDSFVWNQSAQIAFDQLKKAISSAPILLLPDFSIPFVLETYASGIGMGTVLSQKGHPIAFFSKTFNTKLLMASAYVQELAAITVAVKKWRQYLIGHHFTILTIEVLRNWWHK